MPTLRFVHIKGTCTLISKGAIRNTVCTAKSVLRPRISNGELKGKSSVMVRIDFSRFLRRIIGVSDSNLSDEM